MVKKDELIELVQFGHNEIVHFAEALPAEERRPGVGDQWTGRDILAHVIESKRRGAHRIAANARGEDYPLRYDFDALNAEIVADYRPRTWEDLRAAIERSNEEMLAVIQDLSEERLNDPQLQERLEGRWAWQAVVGSAVQHPLGFHLRPWYVLHGQAEYATRMAEKETHMCLELSDEPRWHAIAIYNLACQFALIGDKLAALEKLEAALKLNPDMAGYARDDSDFASLHGSPEFEALAPAEA